MSWLKTALIWAILAIAAFAAHHHFIKVPAQKRAEEKERIVALETKKAEAQRESERAKIIAAQKAAEVVGRALLTEKLEACRASFSEEECEDMVSLWLCVSGKFCTDHADEWLQQYVEEEVGESDSEYCQSQIESYVDNNASDICERAFPPDYDYDAAPSRY